MSMWFKKITMEKITKQKITPFLWFDGNAEEAMNFYTSVFKTASIVSISRHGENGPVFTGTIELEGQQFHLLNGGPMFKFTEAVSFFINCETQEEVDYFWEKLSEGGATSQCGWLKDKFGLSWQVIPSVLGEVLNGKDKAGAQRAMQAMMKMTKLDVAALQKAYDGE